MSDSVQKTLKRIVGIDYGIARIGIAISDPMQIIAMPCPTIKAEKKLEATTAKILAELEAHSKAQQYEIEEIVVGLPLMMSGKLGVLADEVKLFADILRKLAAYPVILWDERLTSVQADRSMREGTMNRKKRAKAVDRVAAVIILQSYLDGKEFRKLPI